MYQGTLKGNIPLNEILDKTNLESLSIKEVANLRTSIESKWNSLNLIRCISLSITFLLLTISFLFGGDRRIRTADLLTASQTL